MPRISTPEAIAIREQALHEAINIMGGVKEYSRAIDASPTQVYNWRAHPEIVPDYKYALLTESKTGVAASRLCPQEEKVNAVWQKRCKQSRCYQSIFYTGKIISLEQYGHVCRNDTLGYIPCYPILIDKYKHLISGYTTLKHAKRQNKHKVSVQILDAELLLSGEETVKSYYPEVSISEQVCIGYYLELIIDSHYATATDASKQSIKNLHSFEQLLESTKNSLQSLHNITPPLSDVDRRFIRYFIFRCLGFSSDEDYCQAKNILIRGIPDLIAEVDMQNCSINDANMLANQSNEKQYALLSSILKSKKIDDEPKLTSDVSG